MIGWFLGPEPLAWRLFQCFDRATLAGWGNFTGYCDPEHDALGLGQEREFEPRDRADLLLSLQHTWLAAQPNSILYNPRTGAARPVQTILGAAADPG